MTDPEAAARQEFLAAYTKDLERGRVRTLIEYQAEQPKFASAIAEEFTLLEDEGPKLAPPDAGAPDSVEGERLAGYRIRKELGRGGQAVVYLAEDETLGRDVALKVLSIQTGLGGDGEEFQRFRREAESAARLDHPGICTVYETGQVDGLAYIAMRYVRGETLAQGIARGRERNLRGVAGGASIWAEVGNLETGSRTASGMDRDLEVVLRLIQRCALALHAAHEQGLVHRDVKPGNIMLSEDGQPVVLDFGIASIENPDHSLTASGVQIGTPYYMAPEQVRGLAVDRRTDVYALGVTMYECLTFRPPFEAGTREDLYRKILDAQPVPARRLNPRIAADVQVVLAAAMDLDPDRRYPTARAFAEDLERLLVFQPIAARRIGPWLRTRRWTQRHPVRTAVIAVGTIALLMAATLWYRAENALADWDRLADFRRAQDLALEADQDLWPIDPARAPAMAAWLERTDAVLTRRPIHETLLRRIRETALPPPGNDNGPASPEDRAIQRLQNAIGALSQHIDEVRSVAAEHSLLPSLLKEKQDLNAKLEAARAAFELSHRWRFENVDTLWQHEVLVDLLRRLDGLRILRADVEARFHRAVILGERSEEPAVAERWREAIAAIAASPLYPSQSLTPQSDLQPLRADPSSGLWEFAHLLSGVPPAWEGDGPYRLTPETGLVLVLVPGSSFAMGTDQGSLSGGAGTRNWDNERPVRQVELDAFYLSKYEMTQAQWLRTQGKNPAVYKPPRKARNLAFTDLHPIENIDHPQAREGLRKLNLLLPSEAQWEYAARAGTKTPWWSGESVHSLEGTANLADRQFGNPPFEEWLDDGFPCHAPVGRFRPNPFGLHDTSGNVWEWCLDDYAPYSASPRAGDGLRSGWVLDRQTRRGGSWLSVADDCRSARRLFADSSFKNGTIGLRPARALDPAGR